MKSFISITCLLLSALISNAVRSEVKDLPEVFSLDEATLTRELMFKLAPKDALLCGTTILGDHLAEATVDKVTHSSNEGLYIYFELSDHLGYVERCSEKVIKKLNNYFESTKGSLKLKTVDRFFQSSSNNLKCLVEGVQLKSTSRNSSFMVVKKIYGERELTPYKGKEITHEVHNDKGIKIGSCDDYSATISSSGPDLSFTDLNAFQEKAALLKKELRLNTHQRGVNYYVGGCELRLDANAGQYWMFFSNKYLLEPSTLIGSNKALLEDGFDLLWDGLITPENCMIRTK